MRMLLPLLLAIALIACESAVPGTYHVASVNDAELPATFEFFGTGTLLSGSLTLKGDMTWSGTLRTHDSNGVEKTETDSGTFTVDGSNVIHFMPGPQSTDGNPFEGSWDGVNQIVIKLSDDVAFIYRR